MSDQFESYAARYEGYRRIPIPAQSGNEEHHIKSVKVPFPVTHRVIGGLKKRTTVVTNFCSTSSTDVHTDSVGQSNLDMIAMAERRNVRNLSNHLKVEALVAHLHESGAEFETFEAGVELLRRAYMGFVRQEAFRMSPVQRDGAELAFRWILDTLSAWYARQESLRDPSRQPDEVDKAVL